MATEYQTMTLFHQPVRGIVTFFGFNLLPIFFFIMSTISVSSGNHLDRKTGNNIGMIELNVSYML